MKNRKSLGNLLIIIIPVIVLAVVFVTKFMVTSNKEGFSVARYVIATVEGVNGHGEASYTLDEVGLSSALFNGEMTSEEKDTFEKFIRGVNFTGNVSTGLSNNDVIIITAQYDSELANKLGIKGSSSTRKYKVSGLKNGEKLDAFSDISIIASGASPFISIKCENNSTHEYIKNLEYEIDKEKWHGIGDEVTITCKADKADAAEKGYYFDTLSVKYKISDTDRYVMEPEGIESEVYQNIAKDATAVITEITDDTTTHMTYEVTGNKSYLYRDGNEEAVNFSLCKVELAKNTTRFAAKHQNYLLVYMHGQIRVPDYSESDDPYEYIDAYFCFVYSDAIITKDGKFVMDTDNIKQRYICAASYEMALLEAKSMIGPGFDFMDVYAG